jgi:uncharacterized protein (DUF433 family)
LTEFKVWRDVKLPAGTTSQQLEKPVFKSMTQEELPAEFPVLIAEDIRAWLAFAHDYSSGGH